MIVTVSFFEFDGISSVPAFQFANYTDLFSSRVTLTLYWKTIQYALIVWAITLVIGFTVSYFLAFHVRSLLWQMALVPGVHGAVLDLQHHPHDFVDSVSRAATASSIKR